MVKPIARTESSSSPSPPSSPPSPSSPCHLLNGKPKMCSMAAKCVAACAAYGKICPASAKGAGEAAHRAIQRLKRGSDIFEEIDGCRIRQIDCDHLTIGARLGAGGFCYVHQATIADVPKSEEGSASSCTSDNKEQQQYAIKFLKKCVMAERKKFERGAADLAIEAQFLSVLSHPHILKLHYVTAGSIQSNIATGRECGFFLILERLYDTLSHRISLWKETADKYNGLIYRATRDLRGCKRRAMLMERLHVAYELTDAMSYLHARNIAYRDLKPENIGFDAKGSLKLFDFGLAKELRPKRRHMDGTYTLTGNTGSRRYMAPEVARYQRYNLSVDVYSFGILLWEMCSLEKPFEGYCEEKHADLVLTKGERPKIDSHGAHSMWPEELVQMIPKCWSVDLHDRPTFTEIMEILSPFKEVSALHTSDVGNRKFISLPKRKSSLLVKSNHAPNGNQELVA